MTTDGEQKKVDYKYAFHSLLKNIEMSILHIICLYVQYRRKVLGI